MKINIPFGEYGYPRMTEKEKELKNKLNIGGFSTPFAKCAQGYSTTSVYC